MPNTEIGRRLGVTETTIRKRIANLPADDLIDLAAVPRGEIAGLITSAILGLSVDLPHLESIRNRLVTYPEVRDLADPRSRQVRPRVKHSRHDPRFLNQGSPTTPATLRSG